jgi:UDP-N-acetylglucosamine--N-acetylmuramyl-(pentapeptide) pyrophosphoryl-undecaprenol N-acetylglucosamine transferase
VIYPDVVFGKGGYASFPVLFAARFLRIPVVIHESDSKPGKVNAWAGKFARRVAVSYPDTASYFKKEITAYTGNPVRKAIQEKQVSGSHEFFGFNKDLKTVFVIGGSLGSRFINSSIMDALSELVDKYQVIHQTGKDNYPIIEETSKVILNGNKNKDRYKAFPYMNDLAMRMASGAADVIISRAGSAVFEIALWGRASILVPIPEETSHDQRTNAYSYARSGACFVIEEKNMSTGVLMSEIERVTSMGMKEKMEESAKAFSRADSAQLIAEGIISIGLEHEK